MRKFSVSEVKEKLFSVHGDVISLDEISYKNMKSTAKFIDKDYGEFYNCPWNVINRCQKHPKKGGTFKLTLKEVKDKLYEAHGGEVFLNESSYKNMSTLAKFIDIDYGEWWAQPLNVIYHKKSHFKRTSEKRKRTWLKKYGVEHISKNKEILRKISKSQTFSKTLSHWRTGEEVVCVGSYERKVVEWLNKKKINFRWQIPFNVLNNKKYFVDLYLIDENKYIEIKGYFRKDAKQKWDWFHNEYLNSELWNEKKLKEMEIL